MRVLVVEDETVVAMELRRLVEAAGFDVLGPAGTLERAAELVAATPPDLAVLDVDLRGRTIAPVARSLGAAAVPFLLLTGFDVAAFDDPILRRAPRLAKPLEPRRLADWLTRAAARLRDG